MRMEERIRRDDRSSAVGRTPRISILCFGHHALSLSALTSTDCNGKPVEMRRRAYPSFCIANRLGFCSISSPAHDLHSQFSRRRLRLGKAAHTRDVSYPSPDGLWCRVLGNTATSHNEGRVPKIPVALPVSNLANSATCHPNASFLELMAKRPVSRLSTSPDHPPRAIDIAHFDVLLQAHRDRPSNGSTRGNPHGLEL